jgi:hypothetical protein
MYLEERIRGKVKNPIAQINRRRITVIRSEISVGSNFEKKATLRSALEIGSPKTMYPVSDVAISANERLKRANNRP